MCEPLSPDYVTSVFIFKRKATILETLKEQDSDKSKMGRYERTLRPELMIGEHEAWTEKMELFVTLVSCFQSLTDATKSSTLHFAWVLGMPLISGILLIENLIWILKIKYLSMQVQFPVTIHLKVLLIAYSTVVQVLLSLVFFFLFIHIQMCSQFEHLHKHIQNRNKRNKIYKKWYTQKTISRHKTTWHI